MNKNTVIGFVLIGVILIGFSWYNTKNYEEQARAKFVADSTARAEALKNAPKIDTSTIQYNDAINNGGGAYNTYEPAPVYKDSLLEVASKAEAQYFNLENEKVKITFTTKGAQAYDVLIKDYYTHDSLDLYLMRQKASN